MKISAAWCVHDDFWYLEESIRSYASPEIEPRVFVSERPWNGSAGDWGRSVAAATTAGARVEVGAWESEDEQRRAAMEWLAQEGFDFALIPDGDEVISAQLLSTLLKVAHADLADRVYVEWDTYWKTPEYVIRPREGFTPLIMVKIGASRHVHLRDFEGGRPLLLGSQHGLMHHLSYVGPDERILRKIETWSHHKEVIPRWWDAVWKAWDSDKGKRNLHPTHPHAYGFAERIRAPSELSGVLERDRKLEGSTRGPDVDVPGWWPSVAAVVPVCAPGQHLRNCLARLARCDDLIAETVVIANGCKEEVAAYAAEFENVKVLANDTNMGFAAACNQGAGATESKVVLFLNDDTIMPRVGLLELIRPLTEQGAVAATGPYTNRCGHFQQVDPTYTSTENLDLFAEDFALREPDNKETDMLVGFCLAVRRSVLEEVGGFDESFGIGTFEDNDLCYRMRRAGYKLLIANRSFVHHEGSLSLSSQVGDVGRLLRTNEQRYRAKWREDLEYGYVSHLSGLGPERIAFREDRRPDRVKNEIRRLAKAADISLCMIVRDEERVLGDCLRSALPYFREIIVVDTGSRDRTREIARSHGAQVHEFPWVDSFSAARNESLKYARGNWIFWMDADDTLPPLSGEALVRAALGAPEKVVGFVVPVQFTDDAGGGTRVDHVKLFRNLPGLRFEFRIHEQILQSLRRTGGEIERCEAVVLHSGYDTSEEGQRKKRARDFGLLKLDLRENPNHPFVLFNIGMTYHYTGDHARAARWLRKCIGASPAGQTHLSRAYVMLGASLRELGSAEDALRTFDTACARGATDPELHFQRGITFAKVGDFANAKAEYLKAVQFDVSARLTGFDTAVTGYKSFHNLGVVCLQQGNYREAKEWFGRAINAGGIYWPSAIALFEAALEHGDLRAAQSVLEMVHGAEGSSENWARMASRLQAELGGPSQAEAFLVEAIERGCSGIPTRLELARLLLNDGRKEEALPLLEALAGEGSAEASYLRGVCATSRGDFRDALHWMERAQLLNPDHEETGRQVEGLRRALSEEGL